MSKASTLKLPRLVFELNSRLKVAMLTWNREVMVNQISTPPSGSQLNQS